MKKAIIAAALISGLTISTGAFAYQGMGGMGQMAGCGFSNYQQLDAETQAKIDQFRKDTQDLRRQMVVKKAEKRAMMKRANPDPAAVGQLTGEIFDLHTTMVEKAKEAGVEQYVGHGKRHKTGMSGCTGSGYGKHGKGHGGHGRGGHGHGHGGGNPGYHHNMHMQQQTPANQI